MARTSGELGNLKSVRLWLEATEATEATVDYGPRSESECPKIHPILEKTGFRESSSITANLYSSWEYEISPDARADCE